MGREQDGNSVNPYLSEPIESMNEQSSQKAKDRKLCHQFLDTGTCSFGDECKFSHATEEPARENQIRPRPIDGKVCHQYYETGTCSFGDECRFSHIESERTRESKSKLRPKDKKERKICHQFLETGTCSFGDECKFSHSEDAIDDRDTMPAIEADGICKLFQKTGSCRFGDACKFSHGTDAISVDQFFDSLPTYLSSEEESLRDKLIDFIDSSRTEAEPASQAKALKDVEVSAAWSSVRPKSCAVELSAWIERRVSDFLDTHKMPRGPMLIGFLGDFDSNTMKRKSVSPVKSAPSKRQR